MRECNCHGAVQGKNTNAFFLSCRMHGSAPGPPLPPPPFWIGEHVQCTLYIPVTWFYGTGESGRADCLCIRWRGEGGWTQIWRQQKIVLLFHFCISSTIYADRLSFSILECTVCKAPFCLIPYTEQRKIGLLGIFCFVKQMELDGIAIKNCFSITPGFRKSLCDYELCRGPVQCFGSGLDPDPYSESGSGSRRARMTHKSRTNYEILCFEVLDVLFWELKGSSVTWTSFMEA